MKKLRLDSRGLPIPFVVYTDKEGVPQFVVNDAGKNFLAIKHDLCAICGQNLLRGRWFLGGPRSAFHPQGAYFDGPMHHECMRYACKVCPYLALGSYRKRIDTIKRVKMPKEEVAVLVDSTMDPTKPPCFVGVMTTHQKVNWDSGINPRFKPSMPFLRIEFWKDGVQLSNEEGWEITRKHLQTPLPPLEDEKVFVRKQ
jgi:hypothetical protein